MHWTTKQLTGQDATHLVSLPDYLSSKPGQLAHPDAVEALERLHQQADSAGVPFVVLSSYRGFDDQKRIWNAKLSGERPIIKPDGEVLDLTRSTEIEAIEALMYFSAIPGASRHHWGTEFDIFPSSILKDNYQVALLPAEFEAGGYAEKLGLWLDDVLPLEGFFRPYKSYCGGVAKEPWHLSFKPVAEAAANQSNAKLILEELKQNKALECRETLCEQFPQLYERFVTNISLE